MSGTPGKKGDRIGPYRLGKRYRGTDPDEGSIHEAHHVETGAPVLVVLPGTSEDGGPRSAWSVRAEGSIHPPYQAVHVEQSPQGRASLHDLTLLLIRLAGATAHIEKRKDAHDHFNRVPSRLRRQVLRWGLAGAAAATVAGLALVLWPHALEETRTRTVNENPVVFSDGQDLAFPIASYPMPEKPFKEQRKPPCFEETEVEIRGGCWIEHTKRAPCPRSTAEYQGKCYIPVRKPDPPPTSLQP
ncbi:hypothetical protein D187_000941 [Cystobacter fuscus DSM 2262]|uniref:Protein kinase n=1 Tax=Cystobacter fuscus (strain ATCC 25194 / DSM 2262 / NBRC 100088 / M29) TaxID=1242864 RepID=S9QWX1_CYSF2|nr:hypothetical protein [Cystobacter fuscus]EPX61158.1 hypothetical protein D187_000941 [Cystobacter fuscus DSM 2262]